ncbi:MAG: hypothetical protein GTO53_12475 [Planctomycetales bacterium]|nr:hypothetical protein [Planctomycetales bacterium]NIM09918.1 hypothetical protein [Planctomycetales bacterium]NIN09357.1 hypothetical protein [Planctomycetales bacterium]NIO35657.1 hypothetical protein [Planctomycetales bacterium]NIO47404.1 hypothetical protein [Planctomycetales bacterium]
MLLNHGWPEIELGLQIPRTEFFRPVPAKNSPKAVGGRDPHGQLPSASRMPPNKC